MDKTTLHKLEHAEVFRAGITARFLNPELNTNCRMGANIRDRALDLRFMLRCGKGYTNTLQQIPLVHIPLLLELIAKLLRETGADPFVPVTLEGIAKFLREAK
jgi:hypothetical protein